MADIPAAMIEAAARVLYAGDWDGATTQAREFWTDRVRRALAAALDGCEIETIRAVRGEDDEGPWIEHVTSAVREARVLSLNPGSRVEWRLVITTPWTPAEEDTYAVDALDNPKETP